MWQQLTAIWRGDPGCKHTLSQHRSQRSWTLQHGSEVWMCVFAYLYNYITYIYMNICIYVICTYDSWIQTYVHVYTHMNIYIWSYSCSYIFKGVCVRIYLYGPFALGVSMPCRGGASSVFALVNVRVCLLGSYSWSYVVGPDVRNHACLFQPALQLRRLVLRCASSM